MTIAVQVSGMVCHAALCLTRCCDNIGLVDDGLDAIHKDSAFTLRLSSYFPRSACGSPAPRCGEHKDFGTFTVLFQAIADLCSFRQQ